ncbi:MAG: VOC family protein [Deltaproteobacteria bacterium]|nr:VOC family protein [Deltaproteobacteria bacterium]
MAEIKHIAIRTPDPEKTAAFYTEVFGLKQVGLGKNGLYLSDGHINLAILKARDGTATSGIEHMGFQVENAERTLSKIEEHGGKALTAHEDQPHSDPSMPQSYFEIKCIGPDNQIIDISTTGWVGTD